MFFIGMAAGAIALVPYVNWRYRELIERFTKPGPGVKITPDGRFAVVDLEWED